MDNYTDINGVHVGSDASGVRIESTLGGGSFLFTRLPLTALANETNRDSLLTKAVTALTNNATYLGIASPTTAQAVTQVAALTRQVDALIRIAANQLDSVGGT